MGKYILPARKKGKKKDVMYAEAAEDDVDWRRRVTIPANNEIVSEASVGSEVVITLKGTVIGLSAREHEKQSYADLDVDLSEVSVTSAGNEFAELAEDEDDA